MVVGMIGVMSAIAAPSVVDMVRSSKADQVATENAMLMAAVRDNARNRGLCLDYVIRPAPPTKGPFTLSVMDVACPDDVPRAPTLLEERPLSSSIESLDVRAVFFEPGSPRPVFGASLDTVHFNRTGGLYRPSAVIQIDGVINGKPRTYRVFPAAGTVQFTEITGGRL